MLGNGDGTFQAATTYNAGGLGGVIPGPVAVADLNADGLPDIVVAECAGMGNCGSGNEVGVLLHAPVCTAPPVVTISATPMSLWPPNGKMVPVTVSGTITDTGCTVTNAAYAVKDEYGEVQPSGPVSLGPRGAYSFAVLLQASRLGTDIGGRLYSITVTASDNAGNAGSHATPVIVPHDQGH